jgi:hypothetical protein
MWRIGLAIFWVLQRIGLADKNSVWLLPEATRELLGNADSIEVFSLGGIADEGYEGTFPNAIVLGSVTVASQRVRRQLVRRMLAANKYNLGGMMCLGAEYGVRVTSGEIVLDFMYCFDCCKVFVSGHKDYCGTGTTSPLPVPLLNKLLTKAKIPLPPRKHDPK